jgi:S-formylglutathione hydrolase FrmB
MRDWIVAALLAHAALLLGVAPVCAGSRVSSESINRNLCGTLLDFTRNGGCDRRIYASALCEPRDLYVYLPPNYDPARSYPLLIWLHGYMHDEREFAQDVVAKIDRAVVCGDLPPIIVAAPDGSLTGDSHWVPFGSWYVNSQRGRFADYISEDVLGFVARNFAVAPDRSAHAIAGFSMGGFGAYSLGLKHPELFKVVAGITPSVNLRYAGPGGRYHSDFAPGGWSLRGDYSGREIVGRFYGGLLTVRAWVVVRPVWGRGPAAIERVSADNPIEILERINAHDSPQHFYIGYGRSDELNVNAQVESFLEVAARRGVHIDTRVYPEGNHSIAFMLAAMPDMFRWLKTHLGDRDATPPAEESTPSWMRPERLLEGLSK